MPLRCSPACPPAAARILLGVTPSGALVLCPACGAEEVVPDEAAVAAAAARDVEVAEQGAETVILRVVGPIPTGEVRRLRHGEQAEILGTAAAHSDGTVESVLVYLRSQGVELVRADAVSCTCPWAAGSAERLRNPLCGVHGDDDGQ